MDLSFYKPTELETWISQKYHENGIYFAANLDIDTISEIFNVTVKTTVGDTKVIWDDDFCIIFLNNSLSEECRREQFFHELCHPLKHVGNQHNMPEAFLELQEIQATHFQFYSAVPAYMLEEFKGFNNQPAYLKILSEEFRLPLPFIQKRIEQIQRRIQQARLDEEFIMSQKNVPVQHEYMPETKRILDKLRNLRRRKGAI